MSAVCVEESIYNLLPHAVEQAPIKEPRYISKLKPYVKHMIQQSKEQWKTIGPPKVELPCPKDFLQKHSKEIKLPKRKKEVMRTRELNVPRRTDRPVMGVYSKKDYITTNAATAIMGVPKKPQQVCVDRRQGDKFLLETSGLIPKYVKKKDYGVTPKYVTKRTEEVQRAQEEYDNYIKETLRKKAMKRLTDDERDNLLEGLKNNWEEVHREFQSLSVEIDTIPKKLHKERLEGQMKQLEHDIQTIEKYNIIYISNK